MKFSELGLKVSDLWGVGKHRDKRMCELPEKYLLWVVLESTMDQYYINRATRELENRGLSLEDFSAETVTVEDF